MVCGPPGTDKTTLVCRLVEIYPRFVELVPVDCIKERMTFKILMRRNDILSVLDGEGGRYSLTKDCIFRAAEDMTASASASSDTVPEGEEGKKTTKSGQRRVVVVDLSVDLVQKLVSNLGGGGIVSSGYGWDLIPPINSALLSNIRSIGGTLS